MGTQSQKIESKSNITLVFQILKKKKKKHTKERLDSSSASAFLWRSLHKEYGKDVGFEASVRHLL